MSTFVFCIVLSIGFTITHRTCGATLSLPLTATATPPTLTGGASFETFLGLGFVALIVGILAVATTSALTFDKVSAHLQANSEGTSLDDVSSGSTLKGAKQYPKMASDLKNLLPSHRHQIVRLWDEDEGEFEYEPLKIGEIIRQKTSWEIRRTQIGKIVGKKGRNLGWKFRGE